MNIPPHVFVSRKHTIRQVINAIDKNGLGVAIVVDSRHVLQGIITAGDVRRMLRDGTDLKAYAEQIMNTHPIFIAMKKVEQSERATYAHVFRKIQKLEKRISETIEQITVPVLDGKKRVVKILVYSLGDHKISLLEKKTILSNNGVRRVLVVGGAGYLGSVLSEVLLSEGYRVRVLDTLHFGQESLKRFQKNQNFELIVGDVRDITTMNAAIDGADAVIHLAAIVGDPASKKYPKETIESNYLATICLSLACKYHQINRFIFASTCSVYGINKNIISEESPLNPVSLYARTKIESEKGILSLADDNFHPIILRMSTLYGLSSRMRFDLVVNIFTKMALTQGIIHIFGGKQWRPFLHVRDAAQAYVVCLKAPMKLLQKLKNPIFNVGSDDQNLSIESLGKLVQQVLPKTKIEIAEAKDEQGIVDRRTYRVSFKKMQKTFHFQTHHTISEAIREIRDAIHKKIIKNVNEAKYYN